MRKILVFQHVATEPLGHLDRLLRESGVRIRYVNFGREPHAEPDVRRYDGLVEEIGGPPTPSIPGFHVGLLIGGW